MCAIGSASVAKLVHNLSGYIINTALAETFTMGVKAGMDPFRQHTSGYGMAPGFPPSWGEPTNMFAGSKDVLKAGMVMSVEPALFIKSERLGVRLIDNVIVTKTGVELLSTTMRDLAVID